MQISELREKSTEDLKQLLLKTRRDQFNLRMQNGTGQLKQNHLFGIARKVVARIHTLLKERGE